MSLSIVLAPSSIPILPRASHFSIHSRQLHYKSQFNQIKQITRHFQYHYHQNQYQYRRHFTHSIFYFNRQQYIENSSQYHSNILQRRCIFSYFTDKVKDSIEIINKKR